MYPSIVVMNADRDLTSAEFKNKTNLYVTSIFRTIQGEGPYAGQCAVFVRLAGCNFGSKKLACEGCDTFFRIDESTLYTVKDLVQAIDAVRKPGDIIVFTGGEPTLQHLLLDVIAHYGHYCITMQLETNGTQVSFFKELTDRNLSHYVHVCVSPKALIKANSYARLSLTVLYCTDSLKFVLTADESSAHHTVPEWALNNTLDIIVYVSPTAVYNKPYAGEVSSIWDDGLVNRDLTQANYSYAAQYALKHNLRLSLQTHLFVGIA